MPLGRCAKRSHNDGSALYFYYDGWNLIQEGPSSSSASRNYVHGARVDEIVKSITYGAGGQEAYHHYDARGHCTLLTNSSGNIMEQYEYDAFGYPYFYDGAAQPLSSSLFGNRFLFTGREWLSDLKLYDYRHRMYQPELGRFMQPIRLVLPGRITIFTAIAVMIPLIGSIQLDSCGLCLPITSPNLP
jgi:RHS repeat-associated protein